MSFTLQYHIALQSMLRHHPTPLWLPLLLLVTVSTHHHHYPLHHNLHFLNTRTPRGNSSSSTNTHTIMLALTSSQSWHQSIIHSQAIDSDYTYPLCIHLITQLVLFSPMALPSSTNTKTQHEQPLPSLYDYLNFHNWPYHMFHPLLDDVKPSVMLYLWNKET